MESTVCSSDYDVLYQAFLCSDIDGDGFISKQDLKIVSGLQNDEDVNCLFESFKQAAGNSNSQGLMNYDEFSKGILDFPFLLKQLKQDIMNNQGLFDEDLFLDNRPDSSRSNDSFYIHDSATRGSIETLSSSDCTISLNLYNSLKRILRLLDKAARVNSRKMSEAETLGELSMGSKEGLETMFEAMIYELKVIEERYKSPEKETILADPRVISKR